MLKVLTRLYRAYNFYASPSKFILRRAIRRFFSDLGPCRRVLDIGSGNAMMRRLLEGACRAELYISTDLDPTDQTAVVCDAQSLSFKDASMDLVASFEISNRDTWWPFASNSALSALTTASSPPAC